MRLWWIAECLCGATYEFTTAMDAEQEVVEEILYQMSCQDCGKRHQLMTHGPTIVEDSFTLEPAPLVEPPDTPLDEWLAGVNALLAEMRRAD